MNSACIDLIYLDPPFNSNANYAAPIGSEAAGAAFKDTWTLNDVKLDWVSYIEFREPKLYKTLLAAQTASDKSYLIYMAIRLLEMKRLLKEAGSIYLHCDSTMSHYLKLVMDAIFGKTNFRNEIVWCYQGSNSPVRYGFNRKHDIILYYAKSSQASFNPQYLPYPPKTLAQYNKFDENKRRYRLHSRKADGTERRLYLDEMPGIPVISWWSDINSFGTDTQSKERTGYPTQKPLKLLERIIRASSNAGDVVFDPFCGCATTCVAADYLERNWLGIDISKKAAELVAHRLNPPQQAFDRQFIHRMDAPYRTDLGKLPSLKASKEILYGIQGGNCAACREHQIKPKLTVDHVIPRRDGGTDHIENLQLLCFHCNVVKGPRSMSYLLKRLEINQKDLVQV